MKADPRAALARAQRRLDASHVTFRRGEVVQATVMVESAAQLARVLELAPKLETLDLNFASRLTPATIRSLFDVPALQRLDDIALGGGAPPAAWDRFFASPNTRGVTRVAIGGEHAAKFARASWPRLERLSISIGGTAPDRRALAQILATPLPHLRSLALDTYGFTAASVDVIVRSPVYPRLRSLVLYDLEPSLGDAAITALASRKTTLATLRLSLAGVTAKGLTTLARLASRLERLEVTECPHDAARLAQLAKVPHVAMVGFWETPDAIGLGTLLAANPRLDELVLGHARTAGAAHCDAIARARRLRVLTITSAPLGAAAATLGKLANLERLELQSSHLGDAGVAGLTTLRRLRSLGLEFCGIGNAGGAALARWPRAAALQVLNVNGNHILDKTIQHALKRRFSWLHPVGLIGYQHVIPDPLEEPDPEPPPPDQRPHRALPPRRRDWHAGLRELVGRPHFASWDGYVEAKLVARSEALIDRCAAAILALGQAADAPAQRAVLRRCITGFNRFAEHLHTIEAETIVETFEAVARYTKLAHEDLADEWRDF
ncbi:MAG: hypothetical protein NT062_27280 [Proteobacteria bacterium]|nr:hypothetical protein [Pseudomonadota bacterium]